MTSPALRAPWTDIHAQRQAGMFGMWAFLATEILFFGGLLVSYAVYRALYPGFVAGAREADVVYGSINTAILMTSSLSMAIGVRAAGAGLVRISIGCFLATVAFGVVFLGLKGLEYREDIAKHLVPGLAFALKEQGAENFWSLYWVMTLLHAVHVVIGLVAVSFLTVLARDREWLMDSPAPEAIGLYWHFVDCVWVVLFPLLYLSGRT